MRQRIEDNIYHAIFEVLAREGFEIVKINLFSSHPRKLEILIDRIDGNKVSINDCKFISNYVSTVMDVENFITDKYFLEVSSPGIERPLVKPKDFHKFSGQVIRVKLNQAINNKKKYKGLLKGISEEDIVSLEDLETNQEISIPYDYILDANIILTDELFKSMLKKG